MNYCKDEFKQNEILQCLCLIVAHLTCIVLQPHKFHCHSSKLQDENLREISSLVVTIKYRKCLQTQFLLVRIISVGGEFALQQQHK